MFNHGWFGGMMWSGILFWIVIIALAIWVVKMLVENSSKRSSDKVEDPEAILKRRYANGEISREQFDEMLKDLRQ